MEMTVFKPSRMQMFARLISNELGVKVVLRGREICVDMERKTIYLPNMEYATEGDVDALRGFCLHEAGHLVYTDNSIYKEGVKNYCLKMLHNALEDEYMERMLEKDFPGARGMLVTSHTKGLQRLFPDGKLYASVTFLGDAKATENEVRKYLGLPEGTPDALVKEAARQLGMDWDDPAIMAKLQKRFELDRVMRIWLMEKRRYPYPLHDWPTHPWRQVFDEVCAERAKSTQQTYDQSVEIMRRLEVEPCLPNDLRPVDEAAKKLSEAEEMIDALREASKELRAKRQEINRKIRERVDQSLEHQDLLEKRDAHREAHEKANDARKKLAKVRERLSESKKAEERTAQRLAKMRKQLREMREDIKQADGELKEMLENEANRLKERVDKAQETMERRDTRTQDLSKAEEEALEKSLEAIKEDGDASLAEKQADGKYDEEAEKIKKEENEAHDGEVKPLEAAEAEAKANADKAIGAANVVLMGIQSRDGEIEEQLSPGAVSKMLNEAFEAYREQGIGEELEEALGEKKEGKGGEGSGEGEEGGEEGEGTTEEDDLGEGSTPDDERAKMLRALGTECPVEARKYCPYGREHDTVEPVVETPNGRAKYEAAKAEYAKVIEESTEKLRKLYSPEKVKIKVNVEQGRINPREAYKIGMACKGVPVDISKVYRTVTTRKDPKVAVTMLIDCSGSMTQKGADGKTNIKLATEAACCLSEVMRALNIPHEIIGHTTHTSKLDKLIKGGEVPPEEAPHFSRFVPFRGYMFKSFEEKIPPVTVFSDFAMEDNLDGEALLWAVARLGARKERTKLCISISDGLPAAAMSQRGELERHLYSICKQIEAREKEGLFLFGIGIGEKLVEKFFKHSHILSRIEDLPPCVLGIVEHVLIELVGTLG